VSEGLYQVWQLDTLTVSTLVLSAPHPCDDISVWNRVTGSGKFVSIFHFLRLWVVQALVLDHLSPRGVDKLLVQSSFLFNTLFLGDQELLYLHLCFFNLRSFCEHLLFVSTSTFDRAFNQLFLNFHFFTTILSIWAGAPF
jgi:hypothetical protein